MQSSKRPYTPRAPKWYICEICSKKFLSRSNSPVKFCGPKCKDRARYIRDRSKRLQKAKHYRDEHKEEINRSRRDRWKLDIEKHRKQNKQNYLRHRSKRIAYACKYQKTHPEVAAHTRNRRRSSVSYAVTKRDLRHLLALFDGKCAYCRLPLSEWGRDKDDSLQWDHVVPLARGGENGVGNLVPCCRKCNCEKNAKFLTEWKARWYVEREIKRLEGQS